MRLHTSYHPILTLGSRRVNRCFAVDAVAGCPTCKAGAASAEVDDMPRPVAASSNPEGSNASPVTPHTLLSARNAHCFDSSA
jgi:hypothetical protein